MWISIEICFRWPEGWGTHGVSTCLLANYICRPRVVVGCCLIRIARSVSLPRSSSVVPLIFGGGKISTCANRAFGGCFEVALQDSTKEWLAVVAGAKRRGVNSQAVLGTGHGRIGTSAGVAADMVAWRPPGPWDSPPIREIMFKKGVISNTLDTIALLCIGNCRLWWAIPKEEIPVLIQMRGRYEMHILVSYYIPMHLCTYVTMYVKCWLCIDQ